MLVSPQHPELRNSTFALETIQAAKGKNYGENLHKRVVANATIQKD
jgi:hypothetical protein